jgi:hypothetical protein
MSDRDRWDAVLTVAERLPDDETLLWLFGDGPIAAVEMQPGACEKLDQIERTSPRMAKIRSLVRAGLGLA